MNKLTRNLLFVFLACPGICFSQSKDFNRVDEYARKTPSSKTSSIDKLADHLTSKFDDEEEKVRSIFVWMTDNIRYNHRVINNDDISIEQRIKKEKAERVLKAKWAVCEGYSNLFQALCSASDISCEVVTGQTKDTRGKIPRIGHAWNVVKVNGKWYPMDVTWGAGGLSSENQKFIKKFNEEYFLGNPSYFIQRHFPKDPIFQLLENPVSFDEFKNNEVIEIKSSSSEQTAFENITDSLNHFSSLNEEEKKFDSCQRMLRFDPKDEYGNYHLAKHHYDKAKESWAIYQAESKEVFDKKASLSWEKIENWEAYMADYRNGLSLTQQYLEKIPSGTKYASTKRRILSSIQQNKKLDEMVAKQFDEYKRYLTKTEAAKN